MNSHLSKEEAFSITDSTDWLETPLASLAPIDAALRCQVCKDFYTTPMITSCSHTFCSLCIRRCLSNDGQCPACRTKDQELKLRFNGAMEELVQAFVKARPDIMAVTVAKIDEKKGSASPKRRREKVEEGDDDDGPRKRTRSSGRNLKSSQKVIVVDSEEDIEDEYLPEGYVHCPICQKEVKEDLINKHLDRACQDEPKTKPRKPTLQPSSIPQNSSKLERLAPPNYSMLKDGPLRKKLTDHGLSAAGNRQLLVQRHTEWTTLWNANCDATRPKTKGELKREMDVWERTQGGQARMGGASMHHASGAQIRDKDFDGLAWSSKHDGDFKSLIANARKKIVKPVGGEDVKGKGEAEGTSVVTTPSSGLTTDTEMEIVEDVTPRSLLEPPPSLPLREPSSGKSRFFQENMEENDEEGFHPPSSQYQDGISVEKESFISDIATSRPIQP